MKHLKVFAIAFLTTCVVVGIILSLYLSHLKNQVHIAEVNAGFTEDELGLGEEEEPPVDIATLTSLEELVKVSDRVNVLLIGVEDTRSDMMMLASYDKNTKLLDFVTIPRDTFNEVPGHNGEGQNKLNAAYGFGSQDGGSEGVRTQVSKILNVPIHYYLTLDYQAVSDIVASIGGVQVTIDQRMKYDDTTPGKELHIDFTKGTHILNGSEAVEYLRWRKNNGGDGSDLARTDRQLYFVKQVITQSITKFKIAQVINVAFKYVETNMPIEEMLYYSTTLTGFDPKEDIKTYRVPGEVITNRLSYYIHNVKETEQMMIEIYKRGYETTDDED